MMPEASQDLNSLRWIRGDLDQTLREARTALEDFVEGQADHRLQLHGGGHHHVVELRSPIQRSESELAAAQRDPVEPGLVMNQFAIEENLDSPRAHPHRHLVRFRRRSSEKVVTVDHEGSGFRWLAGPQVGVVQQTMHLLFYS